MPPPHLDFWPFDLEVCVGVACDLGYPCAKFRLPRPFGFRVRADVRDIRRTTDADHRLMPPPPTGRGHNNAIAGTCAWYSVYWEHVTNIRAIIISCAQTLYALRILRAHGMYDSDLQTVSICCYCQAHIRFQCVVGFYQCYWSAKTRCVHPTKRA